MCRLADDHQQRPKAHGLDERKESSRPVGVQLVRRVIRCLNCIVLKICKGIFNYVGGSLKFYNFTLGLFNVLQTNQR